MNSASMPHLTGRIGLLGVVTLGAGTAIGVSIFSVLQPAAQMAGGGLLPGIVLAGIPMLLFAITYAYLGSALPVSGAAYDWPRLLLSPFVGFCVAWMRIIASVGAIVVLSLVLVRYFGTVVQLPLKPTMGLAITAVFALNYAGVQVAAAAQTILMGVLLAVLAAFVIFGISVAAPLSIGPLTSASWLAIASCVPLLTSLFLGIESATDVGEEIRDAHQNLPLGIGLAILLTTGVYVCVAYVALALVGPARLAVSDAPMLEAARVPFGSLATPLIVGAASISILKTMNSAALVFSRNLFAMARSGVLPAAISVAHPRFGTPHRAILCAYAATMAGLLLPSTVVFLLLAVNLPTMLKYMVCSLSAVQAAKRHPDIHARSRLRLSTSAIKVIGYSAALCALAICALGARADWHPYAVVASWLSVGVAYWCIRRPVDHGPTIESLLQRSSP